MKIRKKYHVIALLVYLTDHYGKYLDDHKLMSDYSVIILVITLHEI
jgi:hypothetical protein